MKIAVAAAFLMLGGAPTNAAVRVDVHFSVLEFETFPHQEVHRSDNKGSTFILDGKIALSQDAYQQSLSNLNGTAHMNNSYGVEFNVKYAIHKGIITQTDYFPGYVQSTAVRRDAAYGCIAKVTYRPLPGRKQIFNTSVDGYPIYDSAIRAENVTCYISDVPPLQ